MDTRKPTKDEFKEVLARAKADRDKLLQWYNDEILPNKNKLDKFESIMDARDVSAGDYQKIIDRLDKIVNSKKTQYDANELATINKDLDAINALVNTNIINAQKIINLQKSPKKNDTENDTEIEMAVFTKPLEENDDTFVFDTDTILEDQLKELTTFYKEKMKVLSQIKNYTLGLGDTEADNKLRDLATQYQQVITDAENLKNTLAENSAAPRDAINTLKKREADLYKEWKPILVESLKKILEDQLEKIESILNESNEAFASFTSNDATIPKDHPLLEKYSKFTLEVLDLKRKIESATMSLKKEAKMPDSEIISEWKSGIDKLASNKLALEQEINTIAKPPEATPEPPKATPEPPKATPKAKALPKEVYKKVDIESFAERIKYFMLIVNGRDHAGDRSKLPRIKISCEKMREILKSYLVNLQEKTNKNPEKIQAVEWMIKKLESLETSINDIITSPQNQVGYYGEKAAIAEDEKTAMEMIQEFFQHPVASTPVAVLENPTGSNAVALPEDKQCMVTMYEVTSSDNTTKMRAASVSKGDNNNYKTTLHFPDIPQAHQFFQTLESLSGKVKVEGKMFKQRVTLAGGKAAITCASEIINTHFASPHATQPVKLNIKNLPANLQLAMLAVLAHKGISVHPDSKIGITIKPEEIRKQVALIGKEMHKNIIDDSVAPSIPRHVGMGRDASKRLAEATEGIIEPPRPRGSHK